MVVEDRTAQDTVDSVSVQDKKLTKRLLSWKQK